MGLFREKGASFSLWRAWETERGPDFTTAKSRRIRSRFGNPLFVLLRETGLKILKSALLNSQGPRCECFYSESTEGTPIGREIDDTLVVDSYPRERERERESCLSGGGWRFRRVCVGCFSRQAQLRSRDKTSMKRGMKRHRSCHSKK